jgi:toxin ParE1/3/4
VISREVRLTEDAERDIESIYDYIAQHDGIAAAEHVWRGLESCWAKLATFPERGNMPKEMVDTDRQYRELHWKPYRIIYRVDRQVVSVYAIVDGRRDLRSFLRVRFGDLPKKSR